ncbi:MAG: hypothetical protein IPL32_07145 [Chloracidobacterium sp.]|nr:hypothetical protein [Chloracidobacterium sp.]
MFENTPPDQFGGLFMAVSSDRGAEKVTCDLDNHFDHSSVVAEFRI